MLIQIYYLRLPTFLIVCNFVNGNYRKPTAAIWMPMEEVVEQTARWRGIHSAAGRNANSGGSTSGAHFMRDHLIMVNICEET